MSVTVEALCHSEASDLVKRRASREAVDRASLKGEAADIAL